jgi:ubiquinone/menaquinone biosynthesis C-methylase UbiE
VTSTNNQDKPDWASRGAYWVKTAPDTVSTTDDLNQLLITLAEIGPGGNVLDIASGAGDPAISIALAVGPEGSVTALDASAEMLVGARNRAAKLGLENIVFENCPMESLPFEAATFDAVTCRFGLMSSTDPVLALQGARHVLKPGRKAAYITHGTREKNTLFAIMWPTLFKFLGEEDTDVGARRYRFSQKNSLETIFKAAGFSHIEEREVAKTVTREKGERFWQTMLTRAFGARLEDFDEAKLEALHLCMEEAFQPFLKGDRYELQSTDMVASGTA